jgi:hypothetical protein
MAAILSMAGLRTAHNSNVAVELPAAMPLEGKIVRERELR